MKTVVIHAARDLRVEEHEPEKPGPRQVEVAIECGGICGSDLHYFNDGGFGTVRVREPMILGHEVAGTIRTVGEGVSGLSVDALMAEFDGRAAEYEDRVDQNTEWTMAQLNNEMKGIRANAEDRINSVQQAAKPSFFDAGLRIAGKGLDSYNGFEDRKYRYENRAHR